MSSKMKDDNDHDRHDKKHDDDHGRDHHKKFHKVIADNAKYRLDEDTSVDVDLATHARDTKGHDLDFKIVKGPANGTLSGFDTETGTFTYTPNANFYGTDFIKYKAFDGKKWDWGVIKFKVKDVADEAPAPIPPVAADATLSVKEKKKLVGDLSDYVTDADADATPDFTFAITDQPDSGRLILNADTGAFVYKPEKDKDREDETVTFTYRVTDEQGLSDTGVITINIDDNWSKKKDYDYHHKDDYWA